MNMKNDEQMYQSVLSRRDAYRTKKERQKRVFLRAVPVLACCCLAAVLGIGYWDHLKKLPEIPSVQVDSEVSGTTLPVTTVPAVTETGQTVQQQRGRRKQRSHRPKARRPSQRP